MFGHSSSKNPYQMSCAYDQGLFKYESSVGYYSFNTCIHLNVPYITFMILISPSYQMYNGGQQPMQGPMPSMMAPPPGTIAPPTSSMAPLQVGHPPQSFSPPHNTTTAQYSG